MTTTAYSNHKVATTTQNGLLPATPNDSTKFLNGLGEYSVPTGGGGGSGTVTSVSVVTANGISGSVATPDTTPAITLTLDSITPSSIVASGTITGSNLSGTNTGDQTNIPGNAFTATKLATPRTISDVSFDGSANISLQPQMMGRISLGF